MQIFLDIDTRRFCSTITGRLITQLDLKRRDKDLIELQFIRAGVVQEMAGYTANAGMKPAGEYATTFLSSGPFAKSGSGTSTVYSAELNLNTIEMDAAFASEPASIMAMLEVEWSAGSVISSSTTLPVKVANDVIRGDEGTPITLPLFYTTTTNNLKATQAEAQAGTNDVTWMTPLRTADAIATLAPPPTWTSVTGKPSTFAPSAHAHTASDITDFNAAVVAVSPPVDWSSLTGKPTLGTAAATDSTDYATAAQGATADTASQPGHTHSIANVSNLQTELNSKQASGSYAAASHTHGNISNSGAIGTTSGVPIITGTSGVLQAGAFGMIAGRFAEGNHTHTFGTTAGTYCQGNDSRLLNLSGGITTVAVVATMPATPSSTTLYIVTG